MAKYRAGVVGCRGIGSSHTSGFVGNSDVEVVAACDIVQDTLSEYVNRWKSNWGNIAKYTDHQEMLAKENLDIVTVATSDHRHADIVVNAANAKVRGIFCEKPMATSVEDGDRMLEACERNNTILSIDHTRRWQPLWCKAKEIITDGEIGPVQYIIGTMGGARSMLFRNGTHLLDMICYFAQSSPIWVCAELQKGYEDYWEYKGDGGHNPDTEPDASGYIHFANDTRGYYVGCKKSPSSFRLEIMCTDGYILINDQKGEVYKGDTNETIQPDSWTITGIPAGVMELVELLDDGGEPASSGREAMKTVEIMIGFLESQRQGNSKVNIPMPRIPGD
ncbi:TPA: Gfo/Idh/MocA family oxidoreductase [Candidatus Poribacteria bacterium]|nr:Gfo/Idh/MocA family oxidoreductase [Candidatus Poribacteria bacterium]